MNRLGLVSAGREERMDRLRAIRETNECIPPTIVLTRHQDGWSSSWTVEPFSRGWRG